MFLFFYFIYAKQYLFRLFSIQTMKETALTKHFCKPIWSLQFIRFERVLDVGTYKIGILVGLLKQKFCDWLKLWTKTTFLVVTFSVISFGICYTWTKTTKLSMCQILNCCLKDYLLICNTFSQLVFKQQNEMSIKTAKQLPR